MEGGHGGETRRLLGVDYEALMSKILSRYSASFFVLRELLQNSDDAEATHSRITLHVAADGSVAKLEVSNSGREFGEADWERVAMIAKGNTDSSSVGLFGVGFYSVFSASDQPEIQSGGKAMRFAKEDKAYCIYERALTTLVSGATVVCPLLAGADATHWASPDEFGKLCSFLCSTLLFARTLATIELVRTDEPAPLIFRRALTPLRTVPYESPAPAETRDGAVIRPLFSMGGRSLEVAKLSVSATSLSRVLAITELVQLKGELDVRKTDRGKLGDVTAGLCRLLGKGLPDRSTLRLLYPVPSGGAPAASSADAPGTASPHSAALLAAMHALREDGRIYIGIGQTDQSTGGGFHLCGGFLPTMERTALDMNDKNCQFWNTALLAMAGSMALHYFTDELLRLSGSSTGALPVKVKVLQKKPPVAAAAAAAATAATAAASTGPADASAPAEEERKKEPPPPVLTPWLAALLRGHTFIPSTPNRTVSKLLSDAFLAQGDRLVVPSTFGPQPASLVFTVPAELRGALEFLTELPLIPPTAAECHCLAFYEQLERHAPPLIRPLDARRLCEQLAGTVLPAPQLGRLLVWYAQMHDRRAFGDADDRALFKRSVKVTLGREGMSRALATFSLHPLGGMALLPPELPLPPETLPHDVAAHLSISQCEQKLGLQKLRFDMWWGFISGHACIEAPESAPLVLRVVGAHLEQQPEEQQAAVVQALRSRRCVPVVSSGGSAVDGGGVSSGTVEPTKMLCPPETYLASSALAQLAKLGLPVATGLEGVPSPLLARLGLRSHPPVVLVHARMEELGWGYRELVGYLESRERVGMLGPEDWAELETMRASSSGGGGGGGGSGGSVYLPTDALRSLGLPTLPWSGTSMTAVERRMLLRLGIAERPPLDTLLDKAAGADAPVRKAALAFLISHMEEHYAAEYDPISTLEIVPLLPIAAPDAGSSGASVATPEPHGRPLLGKPSVSFSEPSPWPGAFAVADVRALGGPAGVAALRLPLRPCIEAVVRQLITAPPTEKSAERTFEYMHRRSAELSTELWGLLSDAPVVPVRSGVGQGVGHAPPHALFFSGARKKYGALLDYCSQSPSSSAGAFLARCGVAATPSPMALAGCVLRNGSRGIDSMQANISAYLGVLKELWNGLRREPIDERTRVALASAPCLIGYHQLAKGEGGGKGGKGGSGGGGATARSWSAVSAAGCFIGDNQRYVELFSPLVAPEDADLKELYTFLGVRSLSEAVTVSARPVAGSVPSSSKLTQQVLRRIEERTCLLLHDLDKPECPLRPNLREGMQQALREQRVVVSEVPGIVSTLRFGELASIEMEAKACALSEGDWLVVHVVPHPQLELRELLEAVGDALATALLQLVQNTDKIVFESLLAWPLDKLSRKGFNVDRFADELAFARAQQQERMACLLQAAGRGRLVRAKRHAAAEAERHAAEAAATAAATAAAKAEAEQHAAQVNAKAQAERFERSGWLIASDCI